MSKYNEMKQAQDLKDIYKKCMYNTTVKTFTAVIFTG